MFGTKIRNLEILREHHFLVPEFFVVSRDMDIHNLDIPWELSAVRSAAGVEDGENHSFAGQFTTFLNVPREEVASRVATCFSSMDGQGVREYAGYHKLTLSEADMHVIVQKMIHSRYSGVCFTANPQGLLNEMVIVVGEGTGDKIVEGKIDTTSYYYHVTDRVYYYEGQEDYLTPDMVERLVKLASDMQPLLGELLDIEFAIVGQEIYILQARAITTLPQDNPLILDNSNIAESYPGINLPLTCSFVKLVYGGIFKSISRRVLKNEKELARYDSVFADMVGSVNGRLYYKISNWYTVIKFLPMSSRIIPIWQDMAGVENKNYDRETVKLPRLVRAKTYYHVIWEMLNVPKNIKKLNRDFEEVKKEFYDRYHDAIAPGELIALFHELQDIILSRWDITLLNDLYSFLFTALVKKRLGEDSNRVLSGISNLESMKPVREMVRLAYEKKHLTREQYEERFASYIRDYGDRNLEELKLESKTFRSNPELLTEKLLQYSQDPEKLSAMYHQLHQEPPAEKPLKGINRFLVREAARGISSREVSRLNRSRIFGMVRLVFTRLGEVYAGEGLIQKPEDIFWLTVEEAFSLAEDKKDMQDIIAGRKRDYQLYACLPAYQRLIFAGKEFDKKHRSVNAHLLWMDQEKLMGTPCSDGIAEGEALVVTDAFSVKDCRDKILVTKMTDPGWVFLLVRAKGILSEKGSLLSHTAILSRELKIPSIVGVDGLLRTIKTGDRIRMNGNTGEIELLKR